MKEYIGTFTCPLLDCGMTLAGIESWSPAPTVDALTTEFIGTRVQIEINPSLFDIENI